LLEPAFNGEGGGAAPESCACAIPTRAKGAGLDLERDPFACEQLPDSRIVRHEHLLALESNGKMQIAEQPTPSRRLAW
jgi:hypothetical protein